MKKRPPQKLKKLSAAKQRRMDELLEKNREGTIASEERVQLEELVSEAEQIIAANAKRLVGLLG